MRRMIPVFLVLALVLAAVSPVAAQEQQAPRKKRVAILDFDYGTVRSYVAGLFGTDVDVGKGISDLLVKHLVQDGTYSVIERKMLDKILAEQNFSNSDRANPTSAAQLGKQRYEGELGTQVPGRPTPQEWCLLGSGKLRNLLEVESDRLIQALASLRKGTPLHADIEIDTDSVPIAVSPLGHATERHVRHFNLVDDLCSFCQRRQMSACP